jgi:hypothetical protein
MQSERAAESVGLWVSVAAGRRVVRERSWSNREAPGTTRGKGYSMMLSEMRISSVSEMRHR